MAGSIFPAVALLSVLAGCQQASEDRNAQLERIVQKYAKEEHLERLRAVFVVTEEGCPSCNKAFAKMVEHHLQDTTVLFWVSAMGSGVDISPFREAAERVVWDYDDCMPGSGLLAGSGAIVLDDGRIDTVVQFNNARTLSGSLSYLADLLRSQRSDSLGGTLEQ